MSGKRVQGLAHKWFPHIWGHAALAPVDSLHLPPAFPAFPGGSRQSWAPHVLLPGWLWSLHAEIVHCPEGLWLAQPLGPPATRRSTSTLQASRGIQVPMSRHTEQLSPTGLTSWQATVVIAGVWWLQAPQAMQRSELGRKAQAAVVIQRAWRRHRVHHPGGSFSPRRCMRLSAETVQQEVSSKCLQAGSVHWKPAQPCHTGHCYI